MNSKFNGKIKQTISLNRVTIPLDKYQNNIHFSNNVPMKLIRSDFPCEMIYLCKIKKKMKPFYRLTLRIN